MRRLVASVARGVSLHTGNVARSVWHDAAGLAVLQHPPQALHHFMVGMVQRVASVGKQFDRLADASRLIDAALLRDGQVHRQVQKRIFTASVRRADGAQGGIKIGKIGSILRVLVHPLACYSFYSFQRLSCAGFGITGAKESANVGRGGVEHQARLPRLLEGRAVRRAQGAKHKW